MFHTEPQAGQCGVLGHKDERYALGRALVLSDGDWARRQKAESRCGAVVKHLLSRHETLDSITSATKGEKRIKGFCM